MIRRIAIKIQGRVQNVGFRYYTVRAARQFGVNGFVRNEPDGSVYAEAEGEDANLAGFTAWCQEGPQWALVDHVHTQDLPVTGSRGFDIR